MHGVFCPLANRVLRAGMALLAVAAVAPALAGNLTATASQNLAPAVSNSSPGSSVSAAYPDAINPVALASATRTFLSASSDGSGVLVTQARAASAGLNTNYTLWDLGSNAALDPGLAAGLVLSLNFHVTGAASLPPVSLSTAALGYDAAVYSVGFQTAASLVNAVFGPVAPFPSVDYVITGNAALLGPVDLRFSLLHNASATGLMTATVSTQASNAGDALLNMALESVTLSSGSLPLAGLALRLETGEMLAVSPVPELPPSALLAAGLVVMALARRKAQTRITC
jgi:hypothetical protein